MKLRGLLPIPNSLNQIRDLNNTPKDNYLKQIRIIDPIMLGVFYGLYVSKELPPLIDQKIELDDTFDSNVDITTYAEVLNNHLFCLWLNKNGFPNESVNLQDYRSNLYKFIELIIEPDYYRDVLIPFYLKISDQNRNNEPSFFYRIIESATLGVEISVNSPEFIFSEFNMIQNDFINEIIKPLELKTRETDESWVDTISLSDEISINEAKSAMENFENSIRIFIKDTLESKIGENWWKTRIPGTIKSECEKRKNSREELPIKTSEHNLINYLDFSDYYEIFKQSNNWKEIYEPYFKDIQWLYTKMMIELRPIRNDLAHNRNIPQKDLIRMKQALQDVSECIHKKDKKKFNNV
jgi:hypothetical protein